MPSDTLPARSTGVARFASPEATQIPSRTRVMVDNGSIISRSASLRLKNSIKARTRTIKTRPALNSKPSDPDSSGRPTAAKRASLGERLTRFLFPVERKTSLKRKLKLRQSRGTTANHVSKEALYKFLDTIDPTVWNSFVPLGDNGKATIQYHEVDSTYSMVPGLNAYKYTTQRDGVNNLVVGEMVGKDLTRRTERRLQRSNAMKRRQHVIKLGGSQRRLKSKAGLRPIISLPIPTYDLMRKSVFERKSQKPLLAAELHEAYAKVAVNGNKLTQRDIDDLCAKLAWELLLRRVVSQKIQYRVSANKRFSDRSESECDAVGNIHNHTGAPVEACSDNESVIKRFSTYLTYEAQQGAPSTSSVFTTQRSSASSHELRAYGYTSSQLSSIELFDGHGQAVTLPPPLVPSTLELSDESNEDDDDASSAHTGEMTDNASLTRLSLDNSEGSNLNHISSSRDSFTPLSYLIQSKPSETREHLSSSPSLYQNRSFAGDTETPPNIMIHSLSSSGEIQSIYRSNDSSVELPQGQSRDFRSRQVEGHSLARLRSTRVVAKNVRSNQSHFDVKSHTGSFSSAGSIRNSLKGGISLLSKRNSGYENKPLSIKPSGRPGSVLYTPCERADSLTNQSDFSFSSNTTHTQVHVTRSPRSSNEIDTSPGSVRQRKNNRPKPSVPTNYLMFEMGASSSSDLYAGTNVSSLSGEGAVVGRRRQFRGSRTAGRKLVVANPDTVSPSRESLGSILEHSLDISSSSSAHLSNLYG
ncbi:hypothetical protein BABINDRAFT_8598 [Babjeviella inositovora NRRL Y-12698]|uniref:Uncharacterized protein n=1 Tax=Babjeviella inositovora NRRL Y-12698 TaxID=984486 RepID=A0A1E3QMN2_9ASCO|nr:uncharacterized protein BABINDRAFT_8598 [Babjeviella inositovora NRRL Y-12698]ODQ78976.1 hypothetical protein BABINDRAFT_8598 [Babjeviella inositovora NRRL Y-12698]